MSDSNQTERADVRSYLIGYAAAVVLSCAAFAAVRWPGLGSTATLVAILVLALSQMIVHFRFFLHITFARSARDDLRLILFSTLIIALMVSGTLVILMNLRGRMM